MVLMHIAGFLREGRAGETAAGNQGGGKKKTEEEEGLSSSADGSQYLCLLCLENAKGQQFILNLIVNSETDFLCKKNSNSSIL